MYNPFSLSGKTILVTGASSGIGKATAIECSKLGANVIITGRSRERLNETFSELESEGHTQVIADLCETNSLQKLVSEIKSIDGIVHSAGITKNIPFQFATIDKLSEVMNLNFFAPTELTRLLVKSKKINKGGSIVFISSVSGVLCSAPASSIYSASKGALNGLIKGIALDLAPRGIRVNSVIPGVVETNIFEDGVISEEQLEENKRMYPLKRFGKPNEIAHGVIYLLSDASAWVTGSNLLIDGGLTLQ
jgi:NAD(P)-dependent dehydrogenase (short-subunit alcohol dehydrogenase family)